MVEKRAQSFAAIPARAVGDRRLTASHWAVLAAICLHDRLGRNGQGCWAGNRRLADLTGINYTNLSATLTDLATWAYIAREPHPLNRRLRVLRVLYSGADADAVKAAATENDLPTGKQSAAENPDDPLPEGKETAGTVCPDFCEDEADQGLNDVEYITQKRRRYSAEAGNENSVETASSTENKSDNTTTSAPTIGERLGRIQQRIKKLHQAVKSRGWANGAAGEAAQIGAELGEIAEAADLSREHRGWCARLDGELETISVGATP